jgi:hypothetical protein
MNIEKEIKQQLKTQRMDQLKRRYFELELDKAALEATANEDAVKETVLRMDQVQKAYDAVEKIPVE